MPLQEAERRQSELELDRLTQWRIQAEAHLLATDTELATLRKDTAARIKALEDERNHALWWGIITLGTSVLGLVTWIWSFIIIGKGH